MSGYKEISPTFLSADAFTPQQNDRITIPYHGYQPYKVDPLKGNKWGSGVAGYSGIGQFTYHGNTDVRDIPTGRTHRHYNGGVFESDFRQQPRRRTDLRRADCRINDQLLPKPLDFPFDPVATNPDLLRKDRDPWYPFKTIHTVYPLQQQNRIDKYDRGVLSGTTRDTLNNYYNHLHGVPRHRDIYQNYYQQPATDTWNPHQQAPPSYSRPHPFLPQFGDKPYALPQHQHSPSTTDMWRNRYRSPYEYTKSLCKSHSDSAIDSMPPANTEYADTPPNRYHNTIEHFVNTNDRLRVNKKWSAQVQQLVSTLLTVYGPSVVDELMKSPDFPDNAWALLSPTRSAPRPVWPPGPTYTVNTKTAQVQERRQLNTNLWSDGPMRDTAYRLQSSLAPRPNDTWRPRALYHDWSSRTNAVNRHKLTQPRYEPDNMDTQVTPLQSYLYPTGDRVSDRLGIPFRAMAQRRYHDLHQEHIPDLRENHRTSKKYHFLGAGIHGAAAFRGQCTGIPIDSQLGHSPMSGLAFHGQCSAPLESCCTRQRPVLPPAYYKPVEKNRQMYRWNECFIEKSV